MQGARGKAAFGRLLRPLGDGKQCRGQGMREAFAVHSPVRSALLGFVGQHGGKLADDRIGKRRELRYLL
ncbi:hypothetical protein GCM10008941_21290 [Rhizomicrobium palustre]